jgi:hypothetical protein
VAVLALLGCLSNEYFMAQKPTIDGLALFGTDADNEIMNAYI